MSAIEPSPGCPGDLGSPPKGHRRRAAKSRLPKERPPLHLGRAPLALALALSLFPACHAQEKQQLLYANGRIEGDEVRIASKIPGRISQLGVREGGEVHAGQEVARLSTPELQASLEQAKAAVEAAKAAVAQAETRLSVLEHHAQKARVDFERFRHLRETGAIPPQRLDQAENALEEAEGKRRIAAAQVEEARAALSEREAAVRTVTVKMAEARITSPIDGVVLLRLAEEGEVFQAGQPIAVVVDPRKLHLEVYVRESEIAKIRLGNPARVKVDAFPERSFEGVVSEVGQRAEFTPRDVHMPDERTRLVFAVKITLENRDRFLKPGMLADAWIRWGERVDERADARG